ncbi:MULTISPECIES: amidohydrolase family protein [Brevibacterium]|nr:MULTISPECIES: amidohydrolase family protein [Brevibacterium]
MNDIELVDHHCHGVLEHDLDRAGFEDLITESDRPGPVSTTFFDTQLGFMIRRYCAPLLDLPAFASPEDYLARRAELGAAEVNRRLLRGQGYNTLLIETGHRGDEILDPAHMGERAESGVAEVVRLERIAEELVESGVDSSRFRVAFSAELDSRLRTAVGVKSIAAYRIGLDFAAARPAADEVDAALAEWINATRRPGRLNDERVIRHLIWEAVDRAVPIQFHIGYGDPDVDLHRCNPLLLTDFLRLSRDSGATVMLLHCYPYHREAGYLAHCFEHVYCDVGLAINYTGAQSAQVIAESLELTPFHKALFSSDAWGAAELYCLGALLFKDGLDSVLAEWSQRHGWPEDELRRITTMIAAGNARRVYGLDDKGENG